MNKIITKSNLTLADFRLYNLGHLFLWKNPFIKYFLVLIVMISLLLTFNLYTGKTAGRYTFFLTMFFPFIILVIILQFIFNTKIIFKSNKFLKEEQLFEITDTNFTCKSATVDFNTPWKKLFKICESEKIFAFYISKLQAFILPKRYLSDKDAKKIREIARENFENKQLCIKK